MWTAVTVLGMMAGVWAFGQLVDRIGRKPTFLLYQAGAVVMVCVYAQLSDPAVMLWAGALMSEAYPTAARATAQNVLWNLGRAIGGFGPLAVGALAARYSFTVAIVALAALYVLDIVATLTLIPELKGRALD